MATYSLMDIIPEPHRFKDADETVYDVPTGAMFSTQQLKKLEQLEHDLPEALAAWHRGEAPGPTVMRLDQVLNDFFSLLVPKMPAPRIEELSIEHKIHFIGWWQAEEQKKAPPPGEAQADQRPSRGRRSPASSSPATTRNESSRGRSTSSAKSSATGGR